MRLNNTQQNACNTYRLNVDPLPYSYKAPKPNEYGAAYVLFGIDIATVAKLIKQQLVRKLERGKRQLLAVQMTLQLFV